MYCLNSNLQVGDIVFLRSISKFGKIIAKSTSGHFSHVALYVGNGLFIEAMPHGVTYLSAFRVFVKEQKNIAVYRISSSQERHSHIPDNAANAAKKYESKSYAFVSAILSPFKGKKPSNLSGLFCSQLVAKAYNEAGLNLLESPDHHITPNSLLLSPHLCDVSDQVVQEVGEGEEEMLQPLDFGTHTRPINKYSKRWLSIVDKSNKVLKKNGIDPVGDIPELFLTLSTNAKHPNIQNLDKEIADIIQEQHLEEFVQEIHHAIVDPEEDIYEEAIRLTGNKEISKHEAKKKFENLSHLIFYKNNIYTEYNQMKFILCELYRLNNLLTFKIFCDLYEKICLLYNEHAAAFVAALAVYRDY